MVHTFSISYSSYGIHGVTLTHSIQPRVAFYQISKTRFCCSPRIGHLHANETRRSSVGNKIIHCGNDHVNINPNSVYAYGSSKETYLKNLINWCKRWYSGKVWISLLRNAARVESRSA